MFLVLAFFITIFFFLDDLSSQQVGRKKGIGVSVANREGISNVGQLTESTGIELNAAYSRAWRYTNLFRSVIIAISHGLPLRITATQLLRAEIAKPGVSWGERENRKQPRGKC